MQKFTFVLKCLCVEWTFFFSHVCSWTKSFKLRRLQQWSCVSACSGSESGRALWRAKTMVRWVAAHSSSHLSHFTKYFYTFLFPEPPGPIDNSKIGVMKGGHIQLKQGKSEEVEKDIKVENQCTVSRHCVFFHHRCRLWSDLRGDLAVLVGNLWRRPWDCSETDGGPGWPRHPSRREEDWGRDESTLR